MANKEIVYFQPEGIKPKYCEAGMLMEDDPDHIWFLDEPCKILKSEVKIIPKEFVHYDKKTKCYLVIKDPAKENIVYKIMAVQHFYLEIFEILGENQKELTIKQESKIASLFHKCKNMEREQALDFASKVLNKADCSFTGMPFIGEPLEDIYDEIYGEF